MHSAERLDNDDPIKMHVSIEYVDCKWRDSALGNEKPRVTAWLQNVHDKESSKHFEITHGDHGRVSGSKDSKQDFVELRLLFRRNSIQNDKDVHLGEVSMHLKQLGAEDSDEGVQRQIFAPAPTAFHSPTLQAVVADVMLNTEESKLAPDAEEGAAPNQAHIQPPKSQCPIDDGMRVKVHCRKSGSWLFGTVKDMSNTGDVEVKMDPVGGLSSDILHEPLSKLILPHEVEFKFKEITVKLRVFVKSMKPEVEKRDESCRSRDHPADWIRELFGKKQPSQPRDCNQRLWSCFEVVVDKIMHCVLFCGIRGKVNTAAMEVLDITEDIREDDGTPWIRGRLMNFVSGPGIPIAMRVNAMVIFFYTIGGKIVYDVLVGCENEHKSNLPVGPKLFGPLFAVFFFLKIRLEFKAMAYVLPPKVMSAGPLTVPFLGWTVSPRVFLAVKVVGCMMTSFDVFSAMIFMARMRAIHTLQRDQTWNVEDVWQRALAQSSVMHFVGWFLHNPPFVMLCNLAYWTVVLQCLWAIGVACPMSFEIQQSSRTETVVQYDLRRPPVQKKSAWKAERAKALTDVHGRKAMCPAWLVSWLICCGVSSCLQSFQRVLRGLCARAEAEETESDYWTPNTGNTRPADERWFWLRMWGWDDDDDMTVSEQKGGPSNTKSGLSPPRYSRPENWGPNSALDAATTKITYYTDCAEYLNLGSDVMTHGRTFEHLAQSGRMSMVSSSKDAEFVGEEIMHWRVSEILTHQNQLRWRFVLFASQRVGTVFLQAYFVGISKNLSGYTGKMDSTDPETWLSLGGVDQLTFINVVTGCILNAWMVYKEWRLHRQLMNRLLRKISQKLNHDSTNKQRLHLRTVGRHSIRAFGYFNCVAALFIILLLCSFLRACFAVVCPCGMWDLALGEWGAAGCVTFSDNGNCSMPTYHYHEWSWYNESGTPLWNFATPTPAPVCDFVTSP